MYFNVKIILSFDINEQLMRMVQKMQKVKKESLPTFAAASCEYDETRQNGLILIIYFYVHNITPFDAFVRCKFGTLDVVLILILFRGIIVK